MGNVYSFLGFSKVLIENNIPFSIRDFLNDEKVDELIQQLVDKQCYEDTFSGAGIDRSCFIPHNGACAIKVDKGYYTDYSDEIARHEASQNAYSIHEICYDGSWVINNLENITKARFCCKQNRDEIKAYNNIIKYRPNLLQYLPQIFAVSSNNCVEIVEYCDACSESDLYSKRYDEIDRIFQDAHDSNVGLNRFNKVVYLDLGMELFYVQLSS